MLPIGTYIYTGINLTSLAPARNWLNKRVRFYVKSSSQLLFRLDSWMVPIASKTGKEWLVVADTGDFCITHIAHTFVSPAGLSSKPPCTAATAPLPPKRIFRYLFTKSIPFSTLTAMVGRGDRLSIADGHIHKLVLKLFLQRKKMRLSYRKAHLLRSVIDAFGFNLVAIKLYPNKEEGLFRLQWHRRKVVECNTMIHLESASDHLLRFATDNPRGLYSSVGFIHYQRSLFPDIPANSLP